MEFTGWGTTTVLDEESLEIRVTKMWQPTFGTASRSILLSDIFALDFRKASALTNGCILIGTASGRTELDFTKRQSAGAIAVYAELTRICGGQAKAAMPKKLQNETVQRLEAKGADKAAERLAKLEQSKVKLAELKVKHADDAAERSSKTKAYEELIRSRAESRNSEAQAKKAATTQARASRITGGAEYWEGTEFFGDSANAKTLDDIISYSTESGPPWLVISSVLSGAFAAWTDRIMIVKSGFMPSLMAGSLGGGRSTTFYFNDVNALEYNAGIASGVLEVLTASYQGSKNADFWSGTTSSRNANADSPFTLSNTLPVVRTTHSAALPALNRLRKMISEVKNPSASAASTQLASKLPDQTPLEALAQLGELHASGILSDEEFSSAKAKLLDRL
jgi:hypothetical protein